MKILEILLAYNKFRSTRRHELTLAKVCVRLFVRLFVLYVVIVMSHRFQLFWCSRMRKYRPLIYNKNTLIVDELKTAHVYNSHV